jgi:hypothetical protein
VYFIPSCEKQLFVEQVLSNHLLGPLRSVEAQKNKSIVRLISNEK